MLVVTHGQTLGILLARDCLRCRNDDRIWYKHGNLGRASNMHRCSSPNSHLFRRCTLHTPCNSPPPGNDPVAQPTFRHQNRIRRTRYVVESSGYAGSEHDALRTLCRIDGTT
jgi:hypothetical protein